MLLRIRKKTQTEVTAERIEGRGKGTPPATYYVKTGMNCHGMAFLDKTACVEVRNGREEPRRPWIVFKGKESIPRPPT